MVAASEAEVDKILSGKYPAKAHAKTVADYVQSKDSKLGNGLIFLEGQKLRMLEDSDMEVPFRQRRPFYYFTGCDLPDCSVTYDIAAQKLTLYIPPVDPSSVVWCGLPLSPTEAKNIYDVDEVQLTTPDLANVLKTTSSSKPLLVLENRVSHEAATQTKGSDVLAEAMDECRAIKDAYEIALIRKANIISASGHHAVMSSIQSATNERELQAIFTHSRIAQGAPEEAYGGIFGAGKAAATLHYVQNNKPLEGKLNFLMDAGAEYNCYASDITRTLPISGTFSKESRSIYETVLKMQLECMKATKSGVDWDQVHVLAHRVAIEGLLEIGILKGGSVDEILEARTSTAFLPHGLGHMMGMDTHDVGGHPNYSDPDKMFCYLRKRGALKTGHVITVEPGIYFCEFIIKPYLADPKHSKYIDEAVLAKYWDVGGVRIEDNIVVTDDGYENLTEVDKEVAEVEKRVQGGR